jgi:CHRD domain
MKQITAILALTLACLAVPFSQAGTLSFFANLSNEGEPPAAAESEGSGTARAEFDTVAQTLRVIVEFENLTGLTTVSHIHCCTAAPLTGNAGVATEVPSFPGFPAGVTAGIYEEIFDLTDASSFNPAFVTANGGTAGGASAALLAGLRNGQAYLNIHSTLSPGGEIRGFLVPAPAGAALLGLGLLAIGAARRKQPA